MTRRIAAVAALLLSGQARADMVPVLASQVERGAILSADDFVVEDLPIAKARGAVAPAEADGLEAKRNLAAGRIVRRSDLVEPRLVRRGDQVSVRVEEGALSITTRGEALQSGAEGDLVRVVTDLSRTLEGRVAADGSVRVALR